MYDTEMIRDFLGQLLCELRANHFELTSPPEALNREFVEELKGYFRKHRTLILPINLFAGRSVSGEEFERAFAHFQRTMAKLRAEQIAHLEALWPLFEEVLTSMARAAPAGTEAAPGHSGPSSGQGGPRSSA